VQNDGTTNAGKNLNAEDGENYAEVFDISFLSDLSVALGVLRVEGSSPVN